ncbi:hypothetical protein T06_13979, partial [Trichinella sp. T6]
LKMIFILIYSNFISVYSFFDFSFSPFTLFYFESNRSKKLTNETLHTKTQTREKLPFLYHS